MLVGFSSYTHTFVTRYTRTQTHTTTEKRRTAWSFIVVSRTQLSRRCGYALWYMGTGVERVGTPTRTGHRVPPFARAPLPVRGGRLYDEVAGVEAGGVVAKVRHLMSVGISTLELTPPPRSQQGKVVDVVFALRLPPLLLLPRLALDPAVCAAACAAAAAAASSGLVRSLPRQQAAGGWHASGRVDRVLSAAGPLFQLGQRGSYLLLRERQDGMRCFHGGGW